MPPTLTRGSPIERTDGPWSGMRDSSDPTTAKKGKYTLLQNAYPQDPELGGGIVGRPGVRLAGQQLGAGVSRRVQQIEQFTKDDGSQFTVGVCAGEVYTFDWSTRLWTKVLSTADLTGDSITLDATTRVALTPFSNLLHISDGVNKPFAWDGTTNGGLTALTASPVLYGRPTISYGKLFGIMASNRVAMVWCEENDLTIGYDNAPYNNYWVLFQTDPDPLVGLVGTNEVLNVYRDRSGTGIVGEIESNFLAAGTRESISETIGTSSPFGLTSKNRRILFIDADGHPHLQTQGGGVEDESWKDFRETVLTINKSALDQAITVEYTPGNVVLFAVPELSQTDCTICLAYRSDQNGAEAVAIWRGWGPFTALSMVLDNTGVPRLMHGTDDGYIYEHGNPDGSLWDDELVTGTVPIEHVFQSITLDLAVAQEKQFDRLDLLLRAASDMTFEVSHETPRGSSNAQTATATASGSRWDTDNWDEANWSSLTIDLHKAVGWNARGRWIRTILRHAVLGEQFGLMAQTISGRTTGTGPGAP